MKKGKVLGKTQIALVLMVAALGTAVWLNMRYSGKTKYLGEATYVGKTDSGSSAVETAAKTKEPEDYFATAVKSRQEAYETVEETVKETLKSEKLNETDKTAAVGQVKQMATRIEQENNIETLLKAKGFEKTVAVIGNNHVNVVVRSDGLTTAQTLQIQDIVTAETDVTLANIKIIAVK